MRDPAPPYAGEGPHALWHVSENAAIRRFEPHISATAARREPRVWAVDTRHLPLYWFPRECPRGAFWADVATSAQDAALLDGSSRVHLVERSWLERMRTAHVVAYRLPEASFTQDPEVGGYWLSRDPVEPVEVVEAGDLVARHAESVDLLGALEVALQDQGPAPQGFNGGLGEGFPALVLRRDRASSSPPPDMARTSLALRAISWDRIWWGKSRSTT